MSLAVTLLLALIATSVLYLAVFYPLRKTYFGALFAERGGVPYAIVFLTTWSLAILALKFRRVRTERKALAYDVIPEGTVVRADNVAELQERVAALEGSMGSTILTRRVARALECFRSRGSTQEVASLLASQAELDAGQVESSYTMLRVFIWAVPILGFIGTVIGIGNAVGSFSASVNAAQDIDSVKNSLGGVTGGLAVAFDTTLLALVMSILLMVPTNLLQKAEDDILNGVSDCCNREILVRADEERAAESATTMVRSALSEIMRAQGARMDEWGRSLSRVGEDLCAQISVAWTEADAAMRERQINHAQALTDLISGASGAAAAEAAKGWNAAVVEIAEGHRRQTEGSERVLAAIAEERSQFASGRKAQEEIQGMEVRRLSERATATLEAIRQGFSDLKTSQAGDATGLIERLEQQIARSHAAAAESGKDQLATLTAAARTCGESLQTVAKRSEEIASSMNGELSRLAPALAGEVQRLVESLAVMRTEQAGLVRDVGASAKDALTSLAATLEGVGKSQRDGLGDAVTSLRDLAAGLTRTLPDGIEGQVHAIEKSIHAYEKLYAAQKVMGSNLKAVATSNGWKTLMLDLEGRMAALSSVMERLDTRLADLKPSPRRGWGFFGRDGRV